jgi:uncharacterized protein YqgC (DUF456 family)
MDKNEMDSYDKAIEVFKKMLLVGTGLSLLVVGLVSLLFPFSPGLFLIFLGLTFSAKGSQSIARIILVRKSLKYLGHKILAMKEVIKKLKKNNKLLK